MRRLVVLSGAGISAESGLKTFRDMGGLWEQYDVTEVASQEAWRRNPELVLRFYNERRKQLFECEPNAGHIGLSQLQNDYDVRIITQNIDDLHERAGSRNVLHLHGELKKARSTVDESLVYDLDNWELKPGDCCEKGSQLRPHVVWFGEPVTAIPDAVALVESADIMVVIGTSLNVYPAAGLLNYTRENVPVFLIDPNPPFQVSPEIHIIAMKAGAGVAELQRILKH
ncbi:NAD-dependent deacylase [Prolixibacter sp. NT017]|uniref:SIR2 family NAD-dependent protein deacylase n=1 Tax=Prolixibacter sp. NT017 TaxID=2652390 RepID=UPI0012747D5C|nr:NAD-dependent deacylase [Prolixibacter sp. NT017]GET27311.1 NAD-dependent protein deacylase [Prolixibacter sp. NT017]